MTLDNLLQTGQLKEHTATAEEIRRLLEAILRNIADAKVTTISDETRFDAAYKAIMQSAMLALLANGYRPSSSAGGHHMTMIQSLPKAIGLSKERMIVLDALRRKRNAADYLGSYIDATAVAACIGEAETLHDKVKGWLRLQHPDLLTES